MRTQVGHRLCMAIGLLLALSAPSSAAAFGGADRLPSTTSYLAFSFADGLDGTSLFGLPALTARGLRAVAFIPTALVGKPSHMPLADLNALAAAGWDLASHLDSGADCTQLPPDDLLRRLKKSHDWLVQRGFVDGARIFGPPGQKWAPELTPLATQAGYQAVMVSQGLGGIVPLDLELVFVGCANRQPLNGIAAAINSAVSHPGRLLILSFHDVVPSNPQGSDADVQRLEQVLDLAVASGLPIVTVSQLMGQDDPSQD